MNPSFLVDALLQPLQAEDDVEHAVDQDEVGWLLDLEVGKQDVGLEAIGQVLTIPKVLKSSLRM